MNATVYDGPLLTMQPVKNIFSVPAQLLWKIYLHTGRLDESVSPGKIFLQFSQTLRKPEWASVNQADWHKQFFKFWRIEKVSPKGPHCGIPEIKQWEKVQRFGMATKQLWRNWHQHFDYATCAMKRVQHLILQMLQDEMPLCCFSWLWIC